MFQIQWYEFTNEELREGFYQWLKANRPEDRPGPDDRGHKAISWRVRLERLAVLRWLHRFRVEELRHFQPEAWKRYASPNCRWRRDAEQGAVCFRRLFPFLPPADHSLFWPPQGDPG